MGPTCRQSTFKALWRSCTLAMCKRDIVLGFFFFWEPWEGLGMLVAGGT